MKKFQNKKDYLFYYLLSFALTIFILSLWPKVAVGVLRFTYVYWLIALAFIVLPMGRLRLGGGRVSQPRSPCLKIANIWLIQLLMAVLVFLADTMLHHLLPFANSPDAWQSFQISDGLTILPVLAVYTSCLGFVVYYFKQPLSVLPFIEGARAEWRLAVYANTWFRQGLFFGTNLLLALSFLTFLSLAKQMWHWPISLGKDVGNLVAFFVTLLLLLLPFAQKNFKQWQKQNKSFALMIAIGLIVLLAALIIFNWLFLAFQGEVVAFHWQTHLAVIRLGLLMLASVLTAFLCVVFCQGQSIRLTTIILLFNPVFWLLAFGQAKWQCLSHWQEVLLLSPNLLMMMTVLVFMIVLAFAGSQYFARLQITFFSNDGYRYQGAMPWMFARAALNSLIVIISLLFFTGVDLLQYYAANLGACLLITYTLSFYLFTRRLPL